MYYMTIQGIEGNNKKKMCFSFRAPPTNIKRECSYLLPYGSSPLSFVQSHTHIEGVAAYAISSGAVQPPPRVVTPLSTTYARHLQWLWLQSPRTTFVAARLLLPAWLQSSGVWTPREAAPTTLPPLSYNDFTPAMSP
jgi:hypothetical protein